MEHTLNPARRVQGITIDIDEQRKRDERDGKISIQMGRLNGVGLSYVEQKRRDDRDKKILSQMWTLNIIGISYVAIAFLIWNLDNIYCGTIRQWRREIGLPWGILLEGHGWWYVFFFSKVLTICEI